MRLIRFFSTNQKISDSIEVTSNNQLHKVDRQLFAYVNSARPDSDSLSVRVTEREHEVLRVALKENRK